MTSRVLTRADKMQASFAVYTTHDCVAPNRSISGFSPKVGNRNTAVFSVAVADADEGIYQSKTRNP